MKRRTTIAIAAAVLGAAAIVPAFAEQPSFFISDAIRRPAYRAAFMRALRGERGLPSWMASPVALEASTMTPGEQVTLDGDDEEVFHACKPHDCGDNQVVLSFRDFGNSASGVILDNGSLRPIGHPTAHELRMLMSKISR